jgi:hypothetical protein
MIIVLQLDEVNSDEFGVSLHRKHPFWMSSSNKESKEVQPATVRFLKATSQKCVPCPQRSDNFAALWEMQSVQLLIGG